MKGSAGMSKPKLISLVLMALIYIALGINHLVNPEMYLGIMPPYLPAHLFLIYLSGVCEIALGAAILVPPLRRWAAWGIIAMLIAFMPVHIHMVVHAAEYPDIPFALLVARIPMQGLFILWAWWYTRPG